MLMRASSVLLAATLAVAATACGGGAAGLSTPHAPARSANGHPQPRPIDWAHPLHGGIPATRANAKAVGHLPFTPTVPRFAVPERAVEVVDAAGIDGIHGSVAFIYEFETGPDFPVDGRVVVIEGVTDQTVADIPAIVASNGSQFHEVVVGGEPALLIEGGGVGRVRLFRDGVVIDVTGPAVSPEMAMRLADAI